ncbi:MAG TPA: J domain-containing protein [Aggregatilineales bacterium]|nr:J domain-containing protein [Anaerolineales bacterium]HRE48195.1 J domain-containing protein [Aggregatilineales bacterium]
MDYKDYYSILGVKKDADAETIRKAFRNLARQHHPDVNPGDAAAEAKFKEISEAYEVLSDPEKRKKYDQLGSDWARYGAAGNGSPNSYTYTGDLGEMFRGFNNGGFSDFFEQMFGRNAGAGGGSAPQRGRDIETPVTITLEEAARGAARMLVAEGREVQVKIPAGVDTGSRVRISGQGQPARAGGSAGDMYLVIEVIPHERFEREGDNLYTDVEIPLYTAILGGKADVSTLDGVVQIAIPEGTQNGRLIRLKGRGMPNMRQKDVRGDLFARVRVILPSGLTAEERRLFEDLRSLRR